MEDYKVWYTDGLDMNMRVVAYRTASFAAFIYNLRESIRRFAVDLGLPKAVAQAARRIMADHGECREAAFVASKLPYLSASLR